MTVPSSVFMAANNALFRFVCSREVTVSASSLLDRQARLCAVQGLDLAFLIGTKHHGMLRRVEIKSHDRLQLFSQVRIVADFEGAGQVWLQAMFVPDAAYALLTDSHRFGHGARAPVGRVGGFLLRGSPDDLQHFGWRDRRPTPRARGILHQSG